MDENELGAHEHCPHSWADIKAAPHGFREPVICCRCGVEGMRLWQDRPPFSHGEHAPKVSTPQEIEWPEAKP